MKLLAITSCTAGVAHTYMAAEALEKVAKERGHQIKVETQGAMGIDNRIGLDEAKDADAIIFANELPIAEKERFKGIPTFKVSPADAIKHTVQIFEAVEKHCTK